MPAKTIKASTLVRTAPGEGSHPDVASVLQEGRQSAIVHVRPGAIWEIPA